MAGCIVISAGYPIIYQFTLVLAYLWPLHCDAQMPGIASLASCNLDQFNSTTVDCQLYHNVVNWIAECVLCSRLHKAVVYM